MAIDWTYLAPVFNDWSFIGIGLEILPLAVSFFLALAFTKTKEDVLKGFLLIYTLTFLIGWAKEVWILITIAFLGGLYFIKQKK